MSEQLPGRKTEVSGRISDVRLPELERLRPKVKFPDQLRYLKFDGSYLVLSSPPIVSDGESLEYVLIWERIS